MENWTNDRGILSTSVQNSVTGRVHELKAHESHDGFRVSGDVMEQEWFPSLEVISQTLKLRGFVPAQQ